MKYTSTDDYNRVGKWAGPTPRFPAICWISTVLITCVIVHFLGCRSMPVGLGETANSTFDFAGRTRTYMTYEPPAPPSAIVFVLHGGGGTAVGTPKIIPDIFRLADERSLLLVFPQGVDKSWNDGRPDPISTAHKERIDDAGFLEALARSISESRAIPADRIFAMGISNGGMMSQRLACDTRLFTKIVSIAANLPEALSTTCSPQGPRSVLFILGTDDPLVPYSGGPVKIFRQTRGIVLSADDSLKFWRGANSCGAVSQKETLPNPVNDETQSERETWNCPQSRVGIIRVIGGGHTWPGGVQYFPESLIGRTSGDFSATEMAFDWFGAPKTAQN